MGKMVEIRWHGGEDRVQKLHRYCLPKLLLTLENLFRIPGIRSRAYGCAHHSL